jgi:hypothetical protein
LVFVGQTGPTKVYGEKSEETMLVRNIPFEYRKPFGFDPKDRYIVCIGRAESMGDSLKPQSYGIYDRKENTIEIRMV